MFEKILVPLDGSVLAEEVLETAVTIAKEIVLLRVPVMQDVMALAAAGGDVPVMISTMGNDDGYLEVEGYLDRVAFEWGRSDLPVTTRIESGGAAETIAFVARDENVDLILMSTHGRTGLGRILLGSVTEEVLKLAPCPVLAMRADRLIKNVLVPLDGSFLAEKAIAPALKIAKASEANVTLFRAQPVELDYREEEFAFYLRAEHGLEHSAHEMLLKCADDYLGNLCEQYDCNDVRVDRVTATGYAADEILAQALEEGIDLIVMSTHGRTGLNKFFYGSVAEKVLRNAPCAVMVVRPEA